MSMKVYLGMKVDALKARFSHRDDGPKPRIDGDLPAGLRLGSRIIVNEAPFLLAGETCAVEYPGEESLVGAYSKVEFGGMETYRLYLKGRDHAERDSMLMVVMEENGHDVAEYYLFREQDEIPLYFVGRDELPPDGDEVHTVEFWIGAEDGIIGAPEFHTPDDHAYGRAWMPEGDYRIPAAEFDERIVLDPYGEHALEVEHLGTMLYARNVEGLSDPVDEFLMPTVERDEEGFRCRVWVGLPLAPADLTLPDAI
ncbi:DUF2491 family protein [Endothiovibrio diazotrophicus]